MLEIVVERIELTISKNNNNAKQSSAAMNATKQKTNTKSLNKLNKRIEQLSLELAKTKNRQRERVRGSNKSNGGTIDRFPRGNSQGKGFGRKQSIVVEEMEYIGEISSNSTAFSLLSSYPVNPGQASTFPWLSTVAKNYEKYKFLKLEWVYKPEVSQYAPNGQTGKVLMSMDYDASDAQPTSKAQMEDVLPHADVMPYQQLVLRCNPREMHANSDAKFIRTGNLPGNSDIKTYDAGNLHVGISGISTNNGVLGELHARYVVELSIPVLNPTNQAPINNSVTLFQSIGEASGASTVSKQMLLATTTTNGLQAVNTAGSIVLPPGNYLIDVVTAAQNSNNGMTLIQSELRKNGTIIGPTSYDVDIGSTNALSVSINMYVSLNGTDALTLTNTATYSTGTTLQYISFRILSV